MYRNRTNGELRINNVGEEVTLAGWVAKKRNFGNLVFIDLRDRYGITQLVFGNEFAEELSNWLSVVRPTKVTVNKKKLPMRAFSATH